MLIFSTSQNVICNKEVGVIISLHEKEKSARAAASRVEDSILWLKFTQFAAFT